VGVPNGEFPEILIAKCRSRLIGDKEVGLWHTLRLLEV
jgi:hypothetical protein